MINDENSVAIPSTCDMYSQREVSSECPNSDVACLCYCRGKLNLQIFSFIHAGAQGNIVTVKKNVETNNDSPWQQ